MSFSAKGRMAITSVIFFAAAAIFLRLVPLPAFAESITNILVNPALDVSRFAPYVIEADVTGNPDSVSVSIEGVNQDGGEYWNYYADGTPFAETITRGMNDADVDGRWTSSNIYPDNIYPEIFFAPSSITWNNTPSDTVIRRSNYQLMHFENPFSMESGSSFFIELNATPRSTVNSADLEVYLVERGKAIDFFNADWRNSPDVEMVGTINRDAVYHHIHAAGFSAHFLVPLTPNADGTVGSKNLDVNGDFWIILYSNSPNNNRGWDLKYHNAAICDNGSSWYAGSQSGWTTTAQSGCPDAHIHLARRGSPSDGVRATVTADYAGGEPITTTQEFLFEPLPNLPPNLTSFISPQSGAVYDTGTVSISWDPASDPNGDGLSYNLYYYDDTTTTAIATGISGLTYDWDASLVPDGAYGLKGEVCDDAASPLCTEFFLPGDFTLDRVEPVYSLSGITMMTSNGASDLAKAGDTVTLSFIASGDISPTLSVALYSGGEAVSGSVSKSASGNDWEAHYVVDTADTDGPIDYVITAGNLDLEYSASSTIRVDVTSPGAVSSDPAAGTYGAVQAISLSSAGADSVLYTTDGSTPTCGSGNIYVTPFLIDAPRTVKAIACDLAGNHSSVAAFDYAFAYDLSYAASSGGSLLGDVSQSVAYGADGTEVTARADDGYVFSGWSDGSLDNPRVDRAVVSNLDVTADFSPLPSGSVPVILPGSTGEGRADVSVPMGGIRNAGDVTYGGLNFLGYVGSRVDFSIALSASDWQPGQTYGKIIDLDTRLRAATLSIGDLLGTFELKEGESLKVDIDGDGIEDATVIFTDLYSNRAEITLLPLAPASVSDGFPSAKVNPDDTDASIVSLPGQKFIFKKNLRTGLTDPDVRELQKYLNRNGFVLVSYGLGSPGNETDFFGAYTRAALVRFQEARGIFPAIGYCGPITRSILNSG